MTTCFRNLATNLVLLAAMLVPFLTQAHEPDHGYLYMRIYKDALGGRFELTAKDINKAIGTQLPDDLTMEDLRPHLSAIQDYFIQRSSFHSPSGDEYTLRFQEPTLLDLEEMEDFVRFHFDLDGVKEMPESIDIGYDVLFDQDSRHRGLLIVEYNWKAGILENEAMPSGIFSSDSRQETLSLTDASIWKGFVALVKLGIWHIWIGLDHILFILALILPAVVRRRNEEVVAAEADYSQTWVPVDRFRPAFIYLIKIITFFTIAHSVTLALAALGVVNISSRIVESIIALSIALAALHNIRPIFHGKEWAIAFGFGLFHGFGFASVLGEKGLSGDYLVPSLLGFNIGVEIGQVLIICLIFPVLYLIRRNRFYPKLITYGSALLIVIALYWFIERGFEVDLPAGAYLRNIIASIFG